MSTPEADRPVVLPRLRIEVFDVNFLRRRFLESYEDRPPKEFLFGPIAYGKAFWAKQGLRAEPKMLGQFTVCQLGKDLYKNAFWRNYRRIWLERKNRSAWHRHLPLELRATERLEYVSARFGGGVDLDTTVLLWPYGWSSNFALTFEGSLTRDLVVDLVDEARSGNPFRAEGKAKNLGQAFNYISKKLEEAIDRSDRIQSVERFVVPILMWNSDSDGRLAVSNNWDQAWAYSKVLSRNSEEGKTRIGANLKGPDFAATLADRGTLISLSCRPGIEKKQVEHATKNMCLFLRTAHVLLTFCEWGRVEAGKSPELDELVSTARRLLRDLPNYYKNPLCHEVLTRLPLARKLLQGDSNENENVDEG